MAGDLAVTDLSSAPEDLPLAELAAPELPGSVVDASEVVASGHVTAWGTLTGACGTLGAELTNPSPSFHTNTYVFASGAFDAKPLRSLAQKRYSGPNNGGSSKCSEAMSIQTLYDCEGITGLKTEVEIAWAVTGQTTDWLGQLGAHKVGVSVSRAYQGPTDQTYTVEDATTLLKKKLGGINASTQNVAAADAWTKQVLHIWTLQPTWVAVLETAWTQLDAALKADTVVLVTVEQGSTAITADTCAD